MWVCILTLNGEDHALADVWAHAIGGLTEVEATILFQDMSDEQRAVIHDLDTARQRHRVVLLWIPNTRWTESEREDYDELCSIWRSLHFNQIYYGTVWTYEHDNGQRKADRDASQYIDKEWKMGHVPSVPLACFHMTLGGGYPSTEQFRIPAFP